jgi:hypothetical protein
MMPHRSVLAYCCAALDTRGHDRKGSHELARMGVADGVNL